MRLSLSILASGSRGNCAVLATEKSRLLIDAGLSERQLRHRLGLVQPEPAGAPQALPNFDGILITHEHDDHVRGLPRLSRLAAPVYLNQDTARALESGGTMLAHKRIFQTGTAFTVGDIEVTPLTVPHDAADPVAFQFQAGGAIVVWVTDLGTITTNLKDRMQRADCIVLESNHDLEMLKSGPYPWPLKQRLLSRLGHLSNETVAEFLSSDFEGQATHLILAHLSENNNHPELARMAADRALKRHLFPPVVHVASQSSPLPAVVI